MARCPMDFDPDLVFLFCGFCEVGPRRAWVIAGQDIVVAKISTELRRSLNFMWEQHLKKIVSTGRFKELADFLKE